MFEIPRLYYPGMEINHETEVVIVKEVDIGNGKMKKVNYVVSRKYKNRLDELEIKRLKKIIETGESEEIKKLKQTIGENESYISELEYEVKSLNADKESLKSRLAAAKEENKKYKSGVKATEMYLKLREEVNAEKKNTAAVRKRQTEFIKDLLAKQRKIDLLEEMVLKLKKQLGEGV